jgi:hypothetical protein
MVYIYGCIYAIAYIFLFVSHLKVLRSYVTMRTLMDIRTGLHPYGAPTYEIHLPQQCTVRGMNSPDSPVN